MRKKTKFNEREYKKLILGSLFCIILLLIVIMAFTFSSFVFYVDNIIVSIITSIVVLYLLDDMRKYLNKKTKEIFG